LFLPSKTQMFGHSRQKKKNPTKRTYNERTIELGILVDYYLWDSMKVHIYNFTSIE
jgi:hypothetical protein